MNYFVKMIKHFHTINKHKWYVFIYSVKAGIPVLGLLHDLSKYSFEEFFESVKYYDGHRSPISYARKDKGYSLARLHHKGRNKHHFEYWLDMTAPAKTPVIPFKYAVEMLCDTLAAGKTYKGKNWYKEYQAGYFEERTDLQWINPKIVEFLREAYADVAKDGNIKRVLNKKNLIFIKFIIKDHLQLLRILYLRIVLIIVIRT